MSEISLVLHVAGLIILFACSAFFSAAETAFISLGSYHFEKLRQQDSKARLLDFWFRYPSRVLISLLVGSTIVNILASVTAASLAYRSSGKLSVALAVSLTTFIILVFGEIIPKSLAKRFSEQIVLSLAVPVKFISMLLEPLNRFLIGFAEVFLSLFRVKISSIIPVLTEDDLKAMISAGKNTGLIEEDERKMIHSIFELGDKMVSEVMIPRVNITAVEDDMRIKDIIQLTVKEGFSRYPVYKGNFDRITGIIYWKDIIARQENNEKIFTAAEVMRPAYFVPETKKINELLRELQREKLQMAIVVDEYGGTAGLVTMEDLVEEIVGEISDEYKTEVGDFQKLGDGSYLVKGSMEYEKANKEMGLALPEGESETIAGFVLNYLGKVPTKGEKFIYNKRVFTVQEADGKTILSLRIKQLSEGKKE